MDKKELLRMDDFLQTKGGREWVCDLLTGEPEFRRQVAELMIGRKRGLVMNTVVFLKSIISWSIGESKMKPNIIKDQCDIMGKYGDKEFEELRSEIFDLLILHREGIREQAIVPMLTLINLSDLKSPGRVCYIVELVSDMAVKYKLHSGQVSDNEDTPEDIQPADISCENDSEELEFFDEEAACTDDAICEYLESKGIKF